MGEIVLRAGTAKADLLISGYEEHLGARGVYGFSVQYAPGRTWQELAQAGTSPQWPGERRRRERSPHGSGSFWVYNGASEDASTRLSSHADDPS